LYLTSIGGSIATLTPFPEKENNVMGKFVSAVESAFNDLVDDITKATTDVATTVSQIQSIAVGLVTPPPPPGGVTPLVGYRVQRPIVLFASDDIPTALNAAVSSAKGAVSKVFGTQYPNITAAGSDGGAVSPFDVNGDLSHVVAALNTDFTNWNLPLNNGMFNQMASTMRTEVYNTPGGKAGTSYGTNYLNANQKIDWVVAYGIFMVDAKNDQNGLVWAFAAGLDDGWART
jgi:hypothetical protein